MTDELIDLLEEQEEIVAEVVDVPKQGFDPLRHIATIFEKRRRPRMDHTEPLADYLAAQYLINPGAWRRAYDFKGKDILPKVALVDLAAMDTPVQKPLPKLAVEVAAKIYRDVFDVLSNRIYIHPRKEKKIQTTFTPRTPEDNRFRQFRGNQVEPLIAAGAVVPYVEGLETRLQYIDNVTGLKQLMGAKVYHDMLRNPELKQEVMQYISTPQYTMDDVFMFSVLQLHKDLFKVMENYGTR